MDVRKDQGAEARWEKNHDEVKGKQKKVESRWEESKEEGLKGKKTKRKSAESRWESSQNQD